MSRKVEVENIALMREKLLARRQPPKLCIVFLVSHTPQNGVTDHCPFTVICLLLSCRRIGHVALLNHSNNSDRAAACRDHRRHCRTLISAHIPLQNSLSDWFVLGVFSATLFNLAMFLCMCNQFKVTVPSASVLTIMISY